MPVVAVPSKSVDIRRMSITRPQVRPVTPVIGAEVRGLALDDVGDADFQVIHDALMEHCVIFFRDQDISIESQKALGARFGELVAHPNDPGVDGHPEVMPIHADENSRRVAGEQWHSDVSCDPRPPMGSILRLHTVPETGGDTLFANMYAAYEALSDRMRAFLDGLTAVHDGGPYYRETNRLIGRDDGGRSYPSAEHPVVRTHPVTRPQGAVREPDVHAVHRGAAAGREPRDSGAACTNTSRARISSAGSAGAGIRSPSGTTAVPSTTRSGTTGRRRGRATG